MTAFQMEVAKLKLTATDTLVVKSQKVLTGEQAMRVRESAYRIIPDGVKVLVCDPSISEIVQVPTGGLIDAMASAAADEAARVDPARGIAWADLDESRREFARKIMISALKAACHVKHKG